MKRSGQHGQALMEMALSLPLFIMMLQALTGMLKLYLDRMELVRLARDTAVFATKGVEVDSDFVRKLAARGRLAGRNIQCHMENIPFLLGSMPLPLGPLQSIPSLLTGQRLSLSCPMMLRPPLSWAVGRDSVMTESLVVKTNPWKHPSTQIILDLFKAGLHGRPT